MFNKEISIQKLKREYFRQAKIRGKYIKSKKFDIFFDQTVENFSSTHEWNEELYINFLFDRYDFVYPQQLKTKKYYKEYQDYFPSLEVPENLKPEIILARIQRDLKIINSKEDKNKYILENWHNLSRYILCWSESFLMEHNDVIDSDTMLKYRTFFHNKKKVRDLIKRILDE